MQRYLQLAIVQNVRKIAQVLQMTITIWQIILFFPKLDYNSLSLKLMLVIAHLSLHLNAGIQFIKSYSYSGKCSIIFTVYIV